MNLKHVLHFNILVIYIFFFLKMDCNKARQQLQLYWKAFCLKQEQGAGPWVQTEISLQVIAQHFVMLLVIIFISTPKAAAVVSF